MGKTRDTRGTFHAKMGIIKDKNSKDITEAEDIKKRWQEYTEELNKKVLNDPDNHNGVVTHLEPDILEHGVKWAWGSIATNKASGGDGIPAELLQILKDDAVKLLHSICQQICKLSSGHRTGKSQFSFQSQRRAMPKNVQVALQLNSITIKIMLKILQVRLQKYMNRELSDVQAGFRKGRGTRYQIASIHWIIEKAREFQKKHLLHWPC